MRRQILADLGIVPWQLRVIAGSAEASAGHPASSAEALEAASAAAAAGTAAAESPGAETPAAETPAVAEVASGTTPRAAVEAAAAAEQRAARPADTPPTAAQPRPAEAPWSVLSLVSGASLLLVEGDASRRDLRLAMDVLAAAAGDFRTKPATRRFDWPPPGAEAALTAGTEAGGRALLAFVDKDLSDHGVRQVLCTAGVAPRLPALAGEISRVTVPALATLAQDPDAKRALWRTLRSDAG